MNIYFVLLVYYFICIEIIYIRQKKLITMIQIKSYNQKINSLNNRIHTILNKLHLWRKRDSLY
jgi:hypothetical protein